MINIGYTNLDFKFFLSIEFSIITIIKRQVLIHHKSK